jgi:hypothetical protein
MHTEHLQRVRFGVVALAWFIAVCVASAIVFVVLALGLVESDSTIAERLEMSAIALGFFTGGLFAGLRAREAPILHGIAIALFSMVVWFLFNVLSTILFPGSEWVALTPNFTLALMLVQIGAAVLGARWGYRTATRGARAA